MIFFFFQAEDSIRDLVRSRGLGDVYKRQTQAGLEPETSPHLRREDDTVDLLIFLSPAQRLLPVSR